MHFGTTQNGKKVTAIDIASDALWVRVLTLGAILNDVRLVGVGYPLTLGSSEVAAYEGKLDSFGSFMGPVVNRIKGAAATIDGQTYRFERDPSGDLTLHSGRTGMQAQVWDVEDQTDTVVTLRLSLPDGLGGFPGNRVVRVQYQVAGTTLRLTATATTDAPTLMNPANHSYWVMDDGLGYAGHTLTIHADHYTESDTTLHPTGRVLPVDGSPYDFRGGRVLTGDARQFFDLNMVTTDARTPLRPVARLTGTSGVSMEMATTECGLQVYDCGTINAPEHPIHHGTPIRPHSGVALEAQSWPGATTHEHFPSIVLRPDRTYTQITSWRFARP